MRTKLVYVLTCAPEKYYIEQALMSAFSARHWNPDAHIVLIVDDLTDKLLVGKRAELLDYVSEKIVVTFDDASLSMMYRSRWIKTSVRQWIQGDFLFVDCDTIITQYLGEVDSFCSSICAVLDSMIPVSEYCESLFSVTCDQTKKIGVDFNEEIEYFNSGVMYVKDVPETYLFYNLWHQYWKEGTVKNLFIDQPALAKANRKMDGIIYRISNYYNFMLWTRAKEPEKAYILHISSYRNPSFLFDDKVLSMVKRSGLQDWIKEFILRPCDTMLPFDYSVRFSSFGRRLEWIHSISRTSSIIKHNFPELIEDFPMQSSIRDVVVSLFMHGCYWIGAMIWMLWKRFQVLRKKDLKDNCCRR